MARTCCRRAGPRPNRSIELPGPCGRPEHRIPNIRRRCASTASSYLATCAMLTIVAASPPVAAGALHPTRAALGAPGNEAQAAADQRHERALALVPEIQRQ